MMKKLFVIFSLVFFLAACGKINDQPKIDFKGPSAPPDPEKIMPTYGPNDQAPAETDVQIGNVDLLK